MKLAPGTALTADMVFEEAQPAHPVARLAMSGAGPDRRQAVAGDIVDLAWDAARARRAKSVCLLLARKAAIFKILMADKAGDTFDFMSEESARSEADAVHDGDPEAYAAFKEILDRLGLTEESVIDVAFRESISDIERLQRLIDNANARRDTVLREIDRRRDAFARRIVPATHALDDVVDAVFE